MFDLRIRIAHRVLRDSDVPNEAANSSSMRIPCGCFRDSQIRETDQGLVEKARNVFHSQYPSDPNSRTRPLKSSSRSSRITRAGSPERIT